MEEWLMGVTINPMKIIMVQVLSISVSCIYLQISEISKKDKRTKVSRSWCTSKANETTEGSQTGGH